MAELETVDGTLAYVITPWKRSSIQGSMYRFTRLPHLKRGQPLLQKETLHKHARTLSRSQRRKLDGLGRQTMNCYYNATWPVHHLSAQLQLQPETTPAAGRLVSCGFC